MKKLFVIAGAALLLVGCHTYQGSSGPVVYDDSGYSAPTRNPNDPGAIYSSTNFPSSEPLPSEQRLPGASLDRP